MIANKIIKCQSLELGFSQGKLPNFDAFQNYFLVGYNSEEYEEAKTSFVEESTNASSFMNVSSGYFEQQSV